MNHSVNDKHRVVVIRCACCLTATTLINGNVHDNAPRFHIFKVAFLHQFRCGSSRNQNGCNDQIRLGKLDRLDEKAVLTADFVKSLKTSRHAIDYVDFSYEAPFIKLKGFDPNLEKDETKN